MRELSGRDHVEAGFGSYHPHAHQLHDPRSANLKRLSTLLLSPQKWWLFVEYFFVFREKAVAWGKVALGEEKEEWKLFLAILDIYSPLILFDRIFPNELVNVSHLHWKWCVCVCVCVHMCMLAQGLLCCLSNVCVLGSSAFLLQGGIFLFTLLPLHLLSC